MPALQNRNYDNPRNTNQTRTTQTNKPQQRKTIIKTKKIAEYSAWLCYAFSDKKSKKKKIVYRNWYIYNSKTWYTTPTYIVAVNN
jgi:hypothetical protein